MPRYFTRAEAEALLPRVEPLLREMQALRAELAAYEEQLAAQRVKAQGNGHSGPGADARRNAEIAELGERVMQRIAEIDELGITVKDLDMGLIDFPCLRDGREVYLCWKLGEPGIDWWHEIDAGYAGRQPLED
jgi:hypothetical protein